MSRIDRHSADFLFDKTKRAKCFISKQIKQVHWKIEPNKQTNKKHVFVNSPRYRDGSFNVLLSD